MIFEKSCGAIVYTTKNNERLYLVEHMNAGHWGVPKGHVEVNETEEMTALREIKEEVGLDVILDSGFRMVETYSPKEGVLKDVVYFVAFSESMDTILQKEEIQDVKWLPLKEATRLIEYKSTQEILIKADAYLDNLNLTKKCDCMKRLNTIYTIIGASVGVFIGHGVYVVWNFKTRPELYAMQSAPWYTSILVYGAFTIVVLLICFMIKAIIKHKQKKK